MKSAKKVIALVVAILLVFSTSAFAAIPNNTVIVGGNAYDFGYIDNPTATQNIIDALNSSSPIYVKIGDTIIGLDGNTVSSSNVGQVTYYDKDGNTKKYAANDGDEIPAVDKAALTSAVAAANTSKTAAVVGTKPGNYAQADVDAFAAAIAAAQAVVDKTDATQAEADAAVTALATAKATFEAAAVKAPVVSSVSAISATSIEATLADGTNATVAANKDAYTVTVGGEAVAVTAVSYAAPKATLTVDMTGKEGDVKVNDVAAAAAVDYKAPIIESVSNVNGNQIVAVFSEKVGKTNAEDETNYKLQNTATGASLLLSTNTANAVLGADGKTLTITLSAADINTAGIGINGLNTLDAVNYRLFINPGVAANTNVFDLKANRMAVNSYKEFTGAIASDVTAPVLQTATLATATKQLTVTFNEKAYSVDTTKVSLTDGTNTLTLAAEDTANVVAAGAAATTIVYTVNNAANVTKLGQLTGTITANFAAGAIKDVVGNAIAATSIVTTATINPKVVADGTYYDELTNKVYVKFNKVMKVSSLTSLANITFTNSADGGLNSATITNGMTLDTTADADTLVFSLNATASAEMESNRAANFDKYSVSLVAGTITDQAGTNLGATNTVVMGYTKDTTAPTIGSAAYNSSTDTLVITFSEVMNGDATHPADTKLAIQKLNSTDTAFAQIDADLDDVDGVDGAIITNTTALTAGKAKWNADKTQLSVMLTNAEATAFEGYNGDKGRYVVFGSSHGLADSNTNALADTTVANKVSIAYTEDTAPTVHSSTAALSPSLIKVVFDKAMDEASLLSATYTIVNEVNANITGTVKSVEVATDKLSVLLTLNAALSAGNYTVTVTGAKDTNGNAISTTNNKKTGMAVATDSTAPTMTGISYTDVDGSHNQSAGDKITVKFSEPVVVAAGKVLSDVFDLDVNGDGTGGDSFGAGATLAAGTKSNELVVILGASSTAIQFATTKVNLVDSDGLGIGTKNTAVSDLAATPNNPTAAASAAIAAPSTDAAPVLQSAALVDVNGNATIDAGDTITLTFDKDLVTKTTWATVNEAGDKLKFTDAAANDGNVVMTASSIVTGGKTVTYTVATSSVTSLQNGIKVNVVAGNTNIVDSWGQGATTAVVSVTVADTAAAKLVGAEFFDGNADAIVGTGDAVVLTFDKAVLAGSVAATTFTGLGTPGTATYGLVKNITPIKVLVTLDDATGFATTNTININNLLPNNNIRTIAGTSAVPSNSAVAIAVKAVEAGTTAVKLNGVTVTAGAATAGVVAADADALKVGSIIRAYDATAGSELTVGGLEYIVVDTDTPANGSDAVNVTNTTLADAGLTVVVYVSKDGTVHVVNFAGDMLN